MSEHQDRPTHEPDLLPTHKVAIWVGALIVVIAVTVIGLWQLLQRTIDRELLTKDLAKPSIALQEVRARDTRLLTTYAVVDTQKGLYRIPVAQAMKAIVKDPTLLAPTPAPPTKISQTTQPPPKTPDPQGAPATKAKGKPSAPSPEPSR